MIQDKSVNLEQGFTMLEIVTVLVLLGVIASVAVPKYFDMQELAEIKADKTALAEAQVRINATFSKKLRQGMECEEAVGEVNQLKLIADSDKDFGSGRYLFNQHLLSGNEILPKGTAITAVAVNGNYSYTSNLFVPYCSGKEESDDDETAVCKFSTADNTYLCFDENSGCSYNGGVNNAKWVTGSPVQTSDGIYIIVTDQPCAGVWERWINNPKNYPLFMIKWSQGEEGRLYKSDWVCNNEDLSTCSEGSNGHWLKKVNSGDWYKEDETGVIFVFCGGSTTNTILPMASVVPDGHQYNNWVRVHDLTTSSTGS